MNGSRGPAMNEAGITAALLTKVRHTWPRAVVLKHADKLTYGVPDFSVTFHHHTSWWEVKFAKPRSKNKPPTFESKGIQDITCKKLAVQGSCHYIIYSVDEEGTKGVQIMQPRFLDEWKPVRQTIDAYSYTMPEYVLAVGFGFDHKLVISAIASVHLTEGHA